MLWEWHETFLPPQLMKLKPTGKKKDCQNLLQEDEQLPAAPPAPKTPSLLQIKPVKQKVLQAKKLLNCLKLIPWFY